jgi:hypothetical protein
MQQPGLLKDKLKNFSYCDGKNESFNEVKTLYCLQFAKRSCTLSFRKLFSRNVAQFGSASALGAEGRRFESCHSERVLSHVKTYSQITSLVQLVERRFPKPDVVGSSPTGRGNEVNTSSRAL